MVANSRPVALCTSAYTAVSLAEAMPRIAELGYRALELQADVPHLFPPQWSLAQAARLRADLDALDLQVVSLAAETGRGYFSPVPAGPITEPSLISPQRSCRRLRLEHLVRSLDLAFALGAPTIVMSSGACLPGLPPALAWEQLYEAIASLLSHAEDLGVLVAIAPRPGHLIETLDEAHTLLDAISHPLLGLSLDTAQIAAQGERLEAAVLASAGRIWTTQLTDARLPGTYRLRPGQGNVDLAGALNALDRIGYTGPLTLHLENYCHQPDLVALETLEYLENVIRPMVVH